MIIMIPTMILIYKDLQEPPVQDREACTDSMSYTCASHTQLNCFHHCLLAAAHWCMLRLAKLYWYWSDPSQETLSGNSVL